MDSKTGDAATNINNFEPLSDFVQEGDCDTLLLYLPGFTKEQLRVQLARAGFLKISGTRPLGDKKWSSFQKDFPVSANCDTDKITAKFEEGILYVRQPKLIVPAEKKDEKPPPTKTPEEYSPAAKTNQEQAGADKTTPDKPVQNKEEKSTKDHEQESSEYSEGTEKLDERKYIPGSTHDDDHKAAATRSSDKSGKIDAELANKETNYRNDIAKLDDYKLDAGSPAAKLMMVRHKMTIFLVVIFAFVLGMGINKLQAWFSKNAEN